MKTLKEMINEASKFVTTEKDWKRFEEILKNHNWAY